MESSKRIFSQLDSNVSAHSLSSKTAHADGDYDDSSSPCSASSVTVYPASSFSISPGPSDTATSFSSASPASESAGTLFSPKTGNPGFSQYLQEQSMFVYHYLYHTLFLGRAPFMPMPAHLSPSYSYPPVVGLYYLNVCEVLYFGSQAHYGMQREVPNIGQLTTCLYELMGEVRTIKHDLKIVKKRKAFPSVSLPATCNYTWNKGNPDIMTKQTQDRIECPALRSGVVG